jgi:hypothetical protein
MFHEYRNTNFLQDTFSAFVKLGGVCLQLFVIFFISFQEIQKLDGSKSEKLKAPFYELLSFSLSGPSSFWISRKLIHKSDEKLKQTPP